jgi:hypothetical protein
MLHHPCQYTVRLTLRLKVQALRAASSTPRPQSHREQELEIKEYTVEDTKGGREKDVSEIHEDASVAQKKWETISAERAEECLREARRRGSKPLNSSRLNIVGEGRAGKTALLRAVSNKDFEDTTSTIGVKQSLLEVNKVDLETKCGGGWSVVEEGTLIMKADEVMTRLAAEIAITEPQVYMQDPPQVGTDRAEKVTADKTAVQKAAAEKVAADAKAATAAKSAVAEAKAKAETEAKAAAQKATPSAGGKSAVEKKSFFALLSGSKKSKGVLTEGERKTLLEAMHKMHKYSQKLSNTGTNRFGVGVKDMVSGEYKKTMDGLNVLLGLQDDENLLKSPQRDIDGMESEILALGIREASELIDYVLYQRASEKQCINGIRDRGRVGKTLNDFVNDFISKKAKLTETEVAALRMYTSDVFRYINGPLRNSQVGGLETWSPGQPHPLPITVLLISRALKKLKRVTGPEDSGIAEMVVWKGMRNTRPTDDFINEGGKWIISHAPCEEVISFSILNINFRCRNGACANVDNRQFGSGIAILTK